MPAMPPTAVTGGGPASVEPLLADAGDQLGPQWLEGGLTAAEVEGRLDRGAVNRVVAQSSQSWAQILKRNALTRLNFLLVILGGATLATGSAPDATFLGIAL